MNIFYLDNDPQVAAQSQCDSRVRVIENKLLELVWADAQLAKNWAS